MSVSIRAPAKGAIGQPAYRRGRCGVSIRAPAKGAIKPDLYNVAAIQVSIRAPAKGAIWPVTEGCSRKCMFQSAPPRRERLHRG